MTHHSQVYNDFYELHRDSFESIVSYYEANRRTIDQLPLEEQLELLAEYLHACFETAQYHLFLRHVDSLIENLIIQNVDSKEGKDLYCRTIFRKAAALYNVERFGESAHIVRQLCRMKPGNKNVRLLYRRTLYRTLSGPVKTIRHTAGFGLLGAALLTGGHLFGNLFTSNDMLSTIIVIRDVLFFSSLAALLVIEMRIRWQVERVTASGT